MQNSWSKHCDQRYVGVPLNFIMSYYSVPPSTFRKVNPVFIEVCWWSSQEESPQVNYPHGNTP